jgi:hypothetical protein
MTAAACGRQPIRREADRKVSNGYLPKGGNTAARIVARLKRDHPAIAKRLAAGEFRSPRAVSRRVSRDDEGRETFSVR